MKESTEIKLLSIDEVVSGKYEIRDVVDDDAMDELVASIKTVGVLLPLIVTKKRFGGYILVAGHRRLHAAKRAKLQRVPCRILDLAEKMIDKIRYQENACRKGMSVVDEGMFFKKLRDDFQTKVVDIADVAGKTAGYVSQRVSLVEGDKRILEAVKSGRLSFAVARELQQIKVLEKRYYYLRFAIDDGASVRTVVRWRTDANSELSLDQQIRGAEGHPDGRALGLPDDQVTDIKDVHTLTIFPDDAGLFRCVCGIVAHTSSSTETPDGWRCRLCMKEKRAAQGGEVHDKDCLCCGRSLEAIGFIMTALCLDCNTSIEALDKEMRD